MKTNLWKIGGLLSIAIALFLLGRSCGVKSVVVKAGRSDTVYAKPDTIRKEVPKLVPYAVVKRVPGKIDSFTTYEWKPVDSAAILEAYNAMYLYAYQERFRYGVVTVEDTISQNMFFGRGVTVVMDSIPVITKNNIIYPPKKPIVYLGFSGYGNKNFGGGIDLSYKTPSDKIFGLGANFIGPNLYYSIQYKIPIRLKKQ